MGQGKIIRSARKRAGLTQAQLGSLVDVDKRTVGNWERELTAPREESLEKLEAVLGVSLTGSDQGSPLEGYSRIELLRELLRREVPPTNE